MADDAATAYWNPAGLAQLRTMEVTGMGATLFEDTRYGFFALGMPTEKWGTFALSGTFTTSGEFERATWDEDLDETFSEKESIVSLGWARSCKRFAYGVTLKAVSQDIGGASGSSIGLDVGLYYRPHRLLSLGGCGPEPGGAEDHPGRRRGGAGPQRPRRPGPALLQQPPAADQRPGQDQVHGHQLPHRPGGLARCGQLALRGGYDTEREQSAPAPASA